MNVHCMRVNRKLIDEKVTEMCFWSKLDMQINILFSKLYVFIENNKVKGNFNT